MPQFKRWRIEHEEKIDLFETPIIKVKYGYITCFALCGDSINSWIERELNKDFEVCKWKQIFLNKLERQFEDEVNRFMSKNGYKSGNLKENGEWNIKSKKISLKLPINICGECDVFAINEKSKRIFLLECKRLHDVVSSCEPLDTMEKIRKKVLREYIPKLLKKSEQIKKYVAEEYPDYEFFSAVVTDVDYPIYIPNGKNYRKNDIMYYCFNDLQKFVLAEELPKSAIFTGSRL